MWSDTHNGWNGEREGWADSHESKEGGLHPKRLKPM